MCVNHEITRKLSDYTTIICKAWPKKNYYCKLRMSHIWCFPVSASYDFSSFLSVLTGGIQLVSRKVTNNRNINHQTYQRDKQFNEDLLISGYVHIKSNRNSFNSHKEALSGLIGVKVSDGTESWRRPFLNEPSKHNCRLIDVNSDGTNDCIVVGNHGLLAAIDPIDGKSNVAKQITIHTHQPQWTLYLITQRETRKFH